MREIKFRGKRKDNGEWVYGYLFASKMSGAFILLSKIDIRENRAGGMTMKDKLEQHEVDPATVGQFTGLRDNHGKGKEVYTGDIVRITMACGEELVGEVVWDSDRFCFAVDVVDGDSELWDFGNIVSDCRHLVEVIGNRFENPELLEVV